MTDVMLGFAEEQFLGKRFGAAYDTAMVAKTLDPFFGNGCIESILQFIESTRPRFARTVSLAILIGTAFLGSKIAGHHAKRSFLVFAKT
jgi:hypothetical protein